MFTRFRAIRVTNANQVHEAAVTELSLSDLSDGDVVVRVEHSSLNYKDALAITGRAPVLRRFPIVPGIDLAGEVVESAAAEISVGDKVLLNGRGVGEDYDGGLSQYARVRSEWLVPLPSNVTTAAAMSLGTAGFTAMMCLVALQQQGIVPGSGPVLVTGASGGVGSSAVYLAAQAGFEVVASTGRISDSPQLKSLGAATVIDRAEFAQPFRPLQKARWAGAIDVAGSHTLANVLAQMKYGGVVAACGLAHGMDLPASVAPFILRGVRLIGIESVNCPTELRNLVWARLFSETNFQRLQPFVNQIGLEASIVAASSLLNGKIRGRSVVDLWQGT